MPENQGKLERLLSAHPELRERMESLLEMVIDSKGELDRADDVEEALISGLQQMGKELLSSWAEEKESQKVAQFQEGESKVKKHGKKSPVVHDLWRD
jgi:hypothetical protein